MSVADDHRAAVGLLRGWGFKVVEWEGCYSRSAGSFAAGKPIGHINHHFVCSTNPSQSYINGLVSNLAAGKTVQWFADVHGVAYLIGVGVMNHAGTGNSSVLNLTKAGQAPPGPARAAGDISGNPHYSGTECQHPGDFTTPWPEPMVDVMVAINAALFTVYGYGAERAINHFEWTSRKIDMSWLGGANSGTKAGTELRRRVAARMTGSEDDMPLNDADLAKIAKVVDERIIAHLGAGAVTDPASVLNTGVSVRISADRNAALAKAGLPT